MTESDATSDPVSWLLIKAGWKVRSSDGYELGHVDEVAGDDTEDIFDGLAVASGAFDKPRYVPSEHVATITQGTVVLDLTRAEALELDEYLEPASSEEIEPDGKAGIGADIGADVREIEGRVLAPTQRHAHPMNVWRRIALWFRSLKG